MGKVLKKIDVNVEDNVLYDGSKTILANVLRQKDGRSGNEELISALESASPSLKSYVLNYLESYKKAIEEDFKEKKTAIYEESKKSGYIAGYKEGRTEGLRQLEDGIKNVRKAASSIEQFKNTLYKDVNSDVINLTIAISKKIVKQAALNNIKALTAIISDAVNSASDSAIFTIHLNSADYEAINKNPAILVDGINKKSKIELKSDPNLIRGDAIIKADFGDIDARIDSQFKEIEKAFAKITPD